jgi:hypothetical protein
MTSGWQCSSGAAYTTGAFLPPLGAALREVVTLTRVLRLLAA